MKNKGFIFAGLAVVGVFATAYFSARDTRKAEKEIARYKKDEPLLDTESKAMRIATEIAPNYICTAVSAAATVTCIILSHKITAGQLAALSATAAGAEHVFNKYRGQIRDILGEEKENEIFEQANEDWVITPALPLRQIKENKTDIPNDTLFEYNGIKFWSTVEKVQQAMYHINRQLILRGYVSEFELLEFLGINARPESEDQVWVSDMFIEDGMEPWIDFYQTYSKNSDGDDLIKISYAYGPADRTEIPWLAGD